MWTWKNDWCKWCVRFDWMDRHTNTISHFAKIPHVFEATDAHRHNNWIDTKSNPSWYLVSFADYTRKFRKVNISISLRSICLTVNHLENLMYLDACAMCVTFSTYSQEIMAIIRQAKDSAFVGKELLLSLLLFWLVGWLVKSKIIAYWKCYLRLSPFSHKEGYRYR